MLYLFWLDNYSNTNIPIYTYITVVLIAKHEILVNMNYLEYYFCGTQKGIQ